MDANTLREIERLVKLSEPIIKLNSLEYGYFTTDGEFKVAAYTLEPLRAANLKVFSLSSLVKLLGDNTLESSLRKFVLVSKDAIIGIEESATERRTYTLTLPQHPVWKLLNDHLKTTEYGQRELLRLMRSKLAGLIPASVLATIQTITITTDGKVSSDLANGKNHVSRELLEAVQQKNGTKLPETLEITAPVYDLPETLETKPTVNVVLETTVNDGAVSFALTTVHNDVTKAQELALEGITSSLGASFAVYRAAL
ncbi:MAG: hypothetical protein HC933_06545 [Pleurocapsa sp. SU_196_0]|nr:hypothetical protein [Pleurocapsa sp. SU_196_0]